MSDSLERLPTEHSMRLHGPWSLALGEAALELSDMTSLEACSRPIGQTASDRMILPSESIPAEILGGQPWLLSRVFRAPTGVTSEQRILLRLRGAFPGMTLRVDVRESPEPLKVLITGEFAELALPSLMPGTHRVSLFSAIRQSDALDAPQDSDNPWPFRQLELIIQGD